MLSREYRLQKEQDFTRVHHTGRFIGQKFLAIKFIPNHLDVSRFGFLVGTKISKKSVVRNKIKRRLRETIRLKLAKIKPGFDVVVMVRLEIVDKTYQEIEQAISGALKEAKLLSK